jgi:4-hydroxybenzoate polyprenyltransferase
MRPKDWIKNTFVLAAIVFSEQRLWTQPAALLTVGAAFVLFCMVSSTIYIINDLMDIEKDRAHPIKCNRPLASGSLSPVVGGIAAVVLLVIALPLGFVIDYQWEASSLSNVDFGATLLAYLLIQGIAYSYYLKQIVLFDIFTIAIGFVMRAVAGALVLDIRITPWLLICMGLLALFLGIAKRRAELVLLQERAGEHRRILDEYSLPLLDQMMSIVTAATIIAYTLFTSTAETLPLKPFPLMMVTVPFVVYAIFRYLYLIHKRDGGGNPAELLLHDLPLAGCIVLWGLTSMALLAVPH